MIKFQYVMFHFPTGKSFTNIAEFLSETDFLKNLNRWNQSGNRVYLYYSVDSFLPQHTPIEIKDIKSLIKYEYIRHDPGFCRVYYRGVKTKTLYAIQNDGTFGVVSYNFYPCTKDGEPEYAIPMPDDLEFDRKELP